MKTHFTILASLSLANAVLKPGLPHPFFTVDKSAFIPSEVSGSFSAEQCPGPSESEQGCIGLPVNA